MFPITGAYAAVLGLMLIGLSKLVINRRITLKQSILDGGDTMLAERMRIHGNFIENVPMALILLAVAEANGALPLWLHGSGLILVIARVLHAVGLHHDQPANKLRIAGAALTWVAMLIAMGSIAYLAIMK